MLLGMGSHFEVWDAARLAESEAQAVAAGMPDVLSNFSFLRPAVTTCQRCLSTSTARCC